MKKNDRQWVMEDYIFCYSMMDMMMVGSYRCNLKVHTGEVMLEAVFAEDFLMKGYKATDLNGIPVTLLDSDLPTKLVFVGDLNLYLALQQEQLLDNPCVLVEVMKDLPRVKRWSF